MKLIEYFGFYRSIGRRSALHGVPIGELDNVRLLFANAGKKVKFRFRGPRAHNTFRSPNTKQSTCLKQDATTFAVYPR